ncbi:MAG: hypothetical protein AAFQ94_29325 [Bacteroidota bacterium]
MLLTFLSLSVMQLNAYEGPEHFTPVTGSLKIIDVGDYVIAVCNDEAKDCSVKSLAH